MYWVDSIGENGIITYFADTESDIALLPTYKKADATGKKVSYGTRCLVLESGNLYILRQDTDTYQPI